MAKGARMLSDIADHETLVAAGAVQAVIYDAHYMADLVTAFLKTQGYRPLKTCAGSVAGEVCCDSTSENSSVIRRAKTFLLNLAAALRLAQWERGRLRPSLPADLPIAIEAFRNAVPPEIDGPAEPAHSIMSELSLQVFRTCHQRLSWSSRATLGIDVLLPTQAPSEDELLDGLADLLWNNRHLAKPEECHG
jgi:hypothetical protein